MNDLSYTQTAYSFAVAPKSNSVMRRQISHDITRHAVFVWTKIQLRFQNYDRGENFQWMAS